MSEDVMYIKWLLNGGPAKAEAEHKALAQASLDQLAADGWKICTRAMKTEPCAEFAILTATIDKDGHAVNIKWNTFNKGWMCRLDYGWGIWRP